MWHFVWPGVGIVVNCSPFARENTILLALNAVAYDRPFAEYLRRQLPAGVAVNASAVNKELTFNIIAVSLFGIGHIAVLHFAV